MTTMPMTKNRKGNNFRRIERKKRKLKEIIPEPGPALKDIKTLKRIFLFLINYVLYMKPKVTNNYDYYYVKINSYLC